MIGSVESLTFDQAFLGSSDLLDISARAEEFMSRSRGFRPFSITLLTLVLILAPGSAAGSSSKVLYKFKGGNDGGHRAGALILDATGNLYGTTSAGGGQTCNGNQSCGTVFQLTPNSNGTWTEKILHRFAGSDGLQPAAGLIFDGAGNLYGTTTGGGVSWRHGLQADAKLGRELDGKRTA
jgi:hypothetical protein